MSLIDNTYFVALLDIPNKTSSGIAGNITYYINKYEPKFLKDLMGYPLYQAFISNEADHRFKDIIEGKEFTDLNTGELNKWDGLIQPVIPAVMNGNTTVTPALNKSIIANYVYYKYRVENATFFTGTSENTNNGETVPAMTLRRRLALVWNEINSTVDVFIAFLDANQDVYPEWTYTDKINALRCFQFMNPIF